jgi:imidazolonepropionase-like amidohydrolase
MRPWKLAACCLVLASVGSSAVLSQSRNQSRAVLYEGARLIAGDGSAAIESGAFVVENGRIVSVGAKGAVALPAGAERVDLTGKTVMPALINVHAHIGYERYTSAEGDSRPEHFTAENILDHLQREAFYGVGTVLDAGSGALDIAGDFLLDQDARKLPPSAQLLLMAGIVPPNGGPDHILIRGTRPLRANFEVTRSPEARAAVQAVAAKNIKHVKIWIGDRRGTYPAMPHEIYDAVIDEAHKLGIKVHAHATSLRDYKDVLRAGADVLVHTIQGEKLDDEVLGLIKQKKPYWTTVLGLGDRSELCGNDPFVEQVYSAKMIADVRATDCKPAANAAAREETLKYNFMKMIESGARLALGTDAGVWPRYSFGWADHHELGRYVQLGLTPAQAIVTTTSRAAELLGITDVGILAPGKRADFLVLNANPLENISNTRQIASIYLRGARLDRDAVLARIRRANATN